MKLLVICLAIVTQVYGDPDACGASRPRRINVGDEEVEIRSPGFPDPGMYPPNSRCEWHFRAGTNESLLFLFTHFHLQNCQLCDCDNVTIYDADSADSSRIIGTYCGEGSDTYPPAAISTGRDAFVVFRSDADLQGSGFEMSTSAIGSGGGGDPCLTGRVETAPRGWFTSPNYPNPYDNDLNCDWTFRAPEGQRVRLNIGLVDIENCCSCDWVTAYDVAAANLRLGRYFDNDVPPIILSTGNELRVEFITDFSITGIGFNATWEFF